MKMVLQFQSVKRSDNDTYSGEATYLTELLFEQTSYQNAEKSIRETVVQTGAEVKSVSMTIDGNSGKWGCTVKYSKASAPLPLAFGVELDTPEAIYDYYIDYVRQMIDERNDERDPNGEYLYDEVKEILGIYEEDDHLSIHVLLSDDDESAVDLPYPPEITRTSLT